LTEKTARKKYKTSASSNTYLEKCRRSEMLIKNSVNSLDRRQFCVKLLSASSLLGLGCNNMFALPQAKQDSSEQAVKHKFHSPSGMTLEQVFRFTYQNSFIPTMNVLASKYGKEEFIEKLKEAASNALSQPVKNYAKNLPKNDLAAFTILFKRPNPVLKNALTFEIVEDTEKAFEIKMTECLWAKTFRDAKAADIGFACICFPDYAVAHAFNPKMKMIRDKTLMQGHDCCNHRYVIEDL